MYCTNYQLNNCTNYQLNNCANYQSNNCANYYVIIYVNHCANHQSNHCGNYQSNHCANYQSNHCANYLLNHLRTICDPYMLHLSANARWTPFMGVSHHRRWVSEKQSFEETIYLIKIIIMILYLNISQFK